MKKEMLALLDVFRYSHEKAPWEERPAKYKDLYHTPNHGFQGWHEVYSYFISCIQLGLMSSEELEEKILLAMKNKRLAREMLGHIKWSKRRVPAYWTCAYLLSTLYGKDEAKLTAWKNVKIEKALYPEMEISVIGEHAFIEFKNSTMPCMTLNGKRLDVHPCGNDLWRVSIHESGVIKFDTAL